MKALRKVYPIGGSKAIVLPRDISKKVNIGSTYSFLIYLEDDLKRYQCLSCLYIFDSDLKDVELYCPCCNSESEHGFKEIE